MRVVLFLLASAVHAQGFTSELTADRQSYAYGETITLTYTVTNTGGETVDLYGSSTCGASLEVGSLRLPLECTADEVVYVFSPGESNSWIWTLVPSDLGVPEADGTQTVEGTLLLSPRGGAVPAPPATATFQAPRFLGGPLAVGFDAADRDAVDALRESVGGTVTRPSNATSGATSEVWQITGTALADAIATLESDGRIRYAERAPRFEGVVYTPTDPAPDAAAVRPPYPNPTASEATFTVRPRRPGPVRIDLLDARGRRVAVLHDGPLASERAFAVSAEGLPAGVYLVRVLADGARQSHRLTVAR